MILIFWILSQITDFVVLTISFSLILNLIGYNWGSSISFAFLFDEEICRQTCSKNYAFLGPIKLAPFSFFLPNQPPHPPKKKVGCVLFCFYYVKNLAAAQSCNLIIFCYSEFSRYFILFIISAIFTWTVFAENWKLLRSLKQHNGELRGGAKASQAGRPWISACIIQGFHDQSDGNHLISTIFKIEV